MYLESPCNFARWAKLQWWPLPQAPFIVLNQEPPPLDYLLPDLPGIEYEEVRVWSEPDGYEAVRRSLEYGIYCGDLSTEIAPLEGYPRVYQVNPAEVLYWLQREGYSIPLELSALVNNPALILADEPTSALDDQNCQEVLLLLEDQAKAAGSALVVVTHDSRLKEKISNKVILVS